MSDFLGLVVYPHHSIYSCHLYRLKAHAQKIGLEQHNHARMESVIKGERWKHVVITNTDFHRLYGLRFDRAVMHASCLSHWSARILHEFDIFISASGVRRVPLKLERLKDDPHNPWGF